MIYEVVSEPGRWGPFSPDHPSVQDQNFKCPVCDEMFEPGDVPAFVNPMPTDADDFQKAVDGRPYTAEVQLAHEKCIKEYR